MTTFSIEEFAAGCKRVMDEAQDRKAAARTHLAAAFHRCGPDEIIRALQQAVPPEANIGELIVHRSPELTMLYARIPARFQSGIHNHTVSAVIGQLRGSEINRIYEDDGNGGLREVRKTTVFVGEQLVLDDDVIHAIENPGDETAHALHLYGGDFGAIAERRSLWSWDDHAQKGFSFPELLKESATAMHRSGNRDGLDALVSAIPASQELVSSLEVS